MRTLKAQAKEGRLSEGGGETSCFFLGASLKVAASEGRVVSTRADGRRTPRPGAGPEMQPRSLTHTHTNTTRKTRHPYLYLIEIIFAQLTHTRTNCSNHLYCSGYSRKPWSHQQSAASGLEFLIACKERKPEEIDLKRRVLRARARERE